MKFQSFLILLQFRFIAGNISLINHLNSCICQRTCKNFWQSFIPILQSLDGNKNVLIHDNSITCIGEFLAPFGVNILNVSHPANFSGLVNYEEIFEEILTTLNVRKEQTIILVAQASSVINILDMAQNMDFKLNQHGYFRFTYRWILVSNEPCDSFLHKINGIFHVMCVEPNSSGMPLKHKMNSRNKDMCHDPNKNVCMKTAVFKESHRIFENIDTSNMNRNKLTKLNIFPNLAHKLNAQLFRIGTHTWEPYILNAQLDSMNKTTYWGQYYDIIREVALYLNMTFEIRLPDDGAWGTVDENGTWNGMVAQLLRREVDFVIAPFTVTHLRAGAVDFADHALEHEYCTGVFRKLSQEQDRFVLLMKPFQQIVWVLIVCSCFIIAFTVALIKQNKRKMESYDATPKYMGRLYVFLDSLYFAFMALIGPIPFNEKLTTKLMVVWGSWFSFSVIVICLWSSNIIAYLTVSNYKAPFTSLRELLAQDQYTYGLDTINGYGHLYLATSTTYPRSNIFENMLQFYKNDKWIFPSDHSVLKEKIQKENHVVFTESAYEYLELMSIESGGELSEPLYSFSYAIALPHNSTYKKLINEASSWITETGIMSKLKEKWSPKAKVHIKQDQVLHLEHIGTIFYILALFIMVSCIILIVEIIFSIYCTP